MSSDEKGSKLSKIETKEGGAAQKAVPKKSIDSKTLLLEIFSEDMINQYKQTHEKEFRDFCREFGISETEENYEKWARLSLVWNALRYAGLFSINYKTVEERKYELRSKQSFREPDKILSDLFSSEGWENKTIDGNYSGRYSSYFDCDESAKLFRDVVDLLWPGYNPKVVLLGDSHAGVLIQFDGKEIVFDLTHGSMVKFEPIPDNPLVSIYAKNTISALSKKGKNLTEDEQISWGYLSFVEKINRYNSLEDKDIIYSNKRKEEISSFYRMFFSKPQQTLDLIKEMERLYYGYEPRLGSYVPFLSTAPLYLSPKELEFLADIFLTKPNIKPEGKNFILEKISEATTIEEKTAILLFTLICAGSFVLDRGNAENIFGIYSSLIRQGNEYALQPLYSVALISEDVNFSERILSGGFNLTQLPWNCQGALYNIVLATQNPDYVKLIEDLVYVDPDMFKTFVKRLVDNKIGSPKIWEVVIRVVEKNPSIIDPALKSSFVEALASDALSPYLKVKVRAIIRV